MPPRAFSTYHHGVRPTMSLSQNSNGLAPHASLSVSSSEVDISSYFSEREDDDEARSAPSTPIVKTSEAASSRIGNDGELGIRRSQYILPSSGIGAWSFFRTSQCYRIKTFTKILDRWNVLQMIGAFVTETFVWGLPNSFAVFLSNQLSPRSQICISASRWDTFIGNHALLRYAIYL